MAIPPAECARELLGLYVGTTEASTTLPVPVRGIAEELFGLSVEEADEWHPRQCGMLDLTRKRVVVRKRDIEARRRFTIAHELGHLCLHFVVENEKLASSGRIRPGHSEKEANLFAAELLMPSRSLYRALIEAMEKHTVGSSTKPDLEWIERLIDRLPDDGIAGLNGLLHAHTFFDDKHYGSVANRAAQFVRLIPWLAERFGVSSEAMTVRLKSLGLLDRFVDASNKEEKP